MESQQTSQHSRKREFYQALDYLCRREESETIDYLLELTEFAERQQINPLFGRFLPPGVGALFTTPEGVILGANRAIEKRLGLPAEQIAGRSWMEFTPRGSEIHYKRVQAEVTVLSTKQPVEWEECSPVGGHQRLFSIPMLDLDGHVFVVLHLVYPQRCPDCTKAPGEPCERGLSRLPPLELQPVGSKHRI